MNDLLGGKVDFMCDQTSNTVRQIKAGRIKVYGVTTKTRVAALPEVPTLQESRVKELRGLGLAGPVRAQGNPQADYGKTHRGPADGAGQSHLETAFY